MNASSSHLSHLLKTCTLLLVHTLLFEQILACQVLCNLLGNYKWWGRLKYSCLTTPSVRLLLTAMHIPTYTNIYICMRCTVSATLVKDLKILSPGYVWKLLYFWHVANLRFLLILSTLLQQSVSHPSPGPPSSLENSEPLNWKQEMVCET